MIILRTELSATLALHRYLSWSQTSDLGETASVSCGSGIAFTISGPKSPGKKGFLHLTALSTSFRVTAHPVYTCCIPFTLNGVPVQMISYIVALFMRHLTRYL